MNESEAEIEAKYQKLLKTLPQFDKEFSPQHASKEIAIELFRTFGIGAEHEAIITGSKLGMTVENVLERTVVHEVEPNGPAVAAGVAKGELLVGIGNENASSLTHDEAIERLRLPHRPLKLILRRVASKDLQQHRKGMGELVKSNLWNAYTSSSDNPAATIKWVFQLMESLLSLLIYGTRQLVNNTEGGAAEESPPSLMDENNENEEKTLDMSERLSIANELFSLMKETADMKPSNDKSTTHPFTLFHQSSPNQSAPMPPPAPTHSAGEAVSPEVAPAPKPHSVLGDISLQDSMSNYQKQFEIVKHIMIKLVSILDWSSEATRVIEKDLLILTVICLDLSHSHLFSPHHQGINHNNNAFEALLLQIFQSMDKNMIASHALPILFYLANSPGRSQQTCCMLIPFIFERVDMPKQLLLRGIMDRFLKKELPVPIRCRVLQAIAEVANKADVTSCAWLVRVCVRSANDPDGKVRRSMAQTLTQLTLKLNSILERGSTDVETESHIFRCKLIPIVQRASEDPVWQVREAIAYNIGGLCEGFGERWSTLLIDLLQNLMADSDLRVKCAAICALPRVASATISFEQQSKLFKEKAGQTDKSVAATRASQLLASQVKAIETLMPTASVLIEDPSPDVRSALAWVLCQLLALMNEAAYLYEDLEKNGDGAEGLGDKCPEYEQLQERLDTSVFPLLLILLHDEDTSVATSCLRSMALTAAAYPPPPPATADGNVVSSSNVGDTDDSFPDEKAKTPPSNLESLSASSTIPEESESSDPKGIDPRPLKMRRKRLPLLSVRHVGKLLPTVQDVGSQRDWRLREWAIAVAPVLHAAASSLNFSQSESKGKNSSDSTADAQAKAQASSFRAQLLELTIKALVDPAESVRRRGVESFISIGRQLITDSAALASRKSAAPRPEETMWVEKTLVPTITNLLTSSWSKERLIGVLMCERALILLLGGRPSDATARNGSLSPLDDDDDDEFLRLSSFSAPSPSQSSPQHTAAHQACALVLPLLLEQGCKDRLPTVRLRSAQALELVFTMRLRPESPSITFSLNSTKRTPQSAASTVAGLRRRFSKLIGEANAGGNALGDADLIPAAQKTLTEMCEDQDGDVRHFARQARAAVDAAAQAVAEAQNAK